jgi:endonuclease YncB( thermonuclease family)
MSNSKMTKCPKCGEKSLKEIKANVFKCVGCKHREDLNDPDYGWLMPAIAVGSFTGLMIAIFGFLLINRATPNNFSTPTRNQTEFAPVPQIVSANIDNIGEAPAQADPKVIAKPIAKAISGNQVLLEISGKSQEVLLCGLNAPTPNSQLFASATQNLQQLLDRTGTDNLMLTAITNANGTPIVELYDRRVQVSINAQQVASGYATSSQVLAKPCRDRVQILANVQQAQEQQKGMWKP